MFDRWYFLYYTLYLLYDILYTQLVQFVTICHLLETEVIVCLLISFRFFQDILVKPISEVCCIVLIRHCKQDI